MNAIAVASLLAGAAAGAGGEPRQPPGDAAWLAPGADVVLFLTESPGECLRAPGDPEQGYLVEVGRAAFRSPLLLGGQAARSGLSCNACHRDGRDNPAFFLEGLSDAPGSADVTSSIFSAVRDDGAFNPRPIPSLVDLPEKPHEEGEAGLHAFIASAIVDEFQGARPPPAVIRGLTAYVAHLDSAACSRKPAPQTVTGDLQTAERTLAAAATALARGDGATAGFLLLAAQNQLGRVHERFPGDREARLRLESLSRGVGALRERIDDDLALTPAGIAEKRLETQSLARFLHKRRGKSLYDAKALARWLAGD